MRDCCKAKLELPERNNGGGIYMAIAALSVKQTEPQSPPAKSGYK